MENLPYFYRARMGAVEPRMPAPYLTFLNSNDTPKPVITDTGVIVALFLPEIWNPHDQKSNRCARDDAGAYLTDGGGRPLFPTHFRLVGDSVDPETLDLGQNKTVEIQAADPGSRRSQDARTNPLDPPYTPASPPFVKSGSADFSVKRITWTADSTALEFDVPNTTAGQGFFREPTVLMQYNVPTGSNLQPGANSYLKNPSASAVDGRLDGLVDANGTVLHYPNSERYLGVYLGTLPAQWWGNADNTPWLMSTVALISGASETLYATFRMQQKNPITGTWETYDQKYFEPMWDELLGVSEKGISAYGADPTVHFAPMGDDRAETSWDPRTSRFGFPSLCTPLPWETPDTNLQFPPTVSGSVLSSTDNVLTTDRPSFARGIVGKESGNTFWVQGLPNVDGWTAEDSYWPLGAPSQNISSDSHYTDADGVLRRAMGAYATDVLGMPMATATSYGGSAATATTATRNRPIVLNRPFQSVAELGAVFSGVPWKNISFFTPESGDSALLDVFCLSEPPATALVAGKVNLNTRQYPVLQAILAGEYKDDLSITSSSVVTPGDSGRLPLLQQSSLRAPLECPPTARLQ